MNHLFRALPSMDASLDALLTADKALHDLPRPLLREAVTDFWNSRRDDIRAGRVQDAAELALEACLPELLAFVRRKTAPRLRNVINGTGVVIHTNMGRSVLARSAQEAVRRVISGYCNLELDLHSGGRGSRYVIIDELLQRLTGAEAAMVVNNNAAAVLLVLDTFCKGGEVIVSRGELVEIGGSFRIPEVMEKSGARLREVGATNRCHLHDYAAAINEDTRALMRVHTSNYRIVGFTESVPREELAEIAHGHGLPLIEDLGSGAIVDLEPFGEPTVQRSLHAGVDVASFSGDKLLGGPQAGLIVGKREYIERIKKHPLARALRLDKMTLAALHATLSAYLDAEIAVREIPTLAMLSASEDKLHAKALRLQKALADTGVSSQLVWTGDAVGGGSAPAQELTGWAVAIEPGELSVDELEEKLRVRTKPIVARIHHGQYLLCVRTIREEDFAEIAAAAAEAIR